MSSQLSSKLCSNLMALVNLACACTLVAPTWLLERGEIRKNWNCLKGGKKQGRVLKRHKTKSIAESLKFHCQHCRH